MYLHHNYFNISFPGNKRGLSCLVSSASVQGLAFQSRHDCFRKMTSSNPQWVKTAPRCRRTLGHRVWWKTRSWCYDVKMLPCKISYILDRSVGLLWTKNAIQKKSRLKNKPEKQNLNIFKRTNKGWQKAKQIHICLSCMFFWCDLTWESGMLQWH